ncbi:unnamed protein product [Auanema sp. JU1783]|nr:unnamed protein product [Auanema sp. JU1783]
MSISGGRLAAELCCALINEHFGSTVMQVAEVLIKEPGPLPAIGCRLRGKVSLHNIKKAIVVLEQFQIVNFKLDSSMRVQYSIDFDQILGFVKSPRCAYIMKTLYGSAAETIFLEIFAKGRLTCSETLRRVTETADFSEGNLTIDQCKEIFCRLSETQFIKRCPPIKTNLRGCPLFETSYDPFIMPDKIFEINPSGAVKTTRESLKRKHGPDHDEDVYWCINWTRFDRYVRDFMVLELVMPNSEILQEKSEQLCKDTFFALLKANETRSSSIKAANSAHVSVFDILRYAKENNLSLDKNGVDWALKSLVEESSGVLRKVGDSSGGLFVTDFERAITLLCQNHIESLIREQLDTKAVRIFRLLQNKGHLEEEHIEKLTMMSSKETRELLYALQEEGYIFTRPFGKTNDFAPARTLYLYYVNLKQTVQLLVEYTCKTLRNLMLRRQHEYKENKSLSDKQLTIRSISEEIRADPNKDELTKQQEISEVQETYMPPADKLKFDQFLKSRLLLESAECEVEKVLLTFRIFLDLDSRRVAS